MPRGCVGGYMPIKNAPGEQKTRRKKKVRKKKYQKSVISSLPTAVAELFKKADLTSAETEAQEFMLTYYGENSVERVQYNKLSLAIQRYAEQASEMRFKRNKKGRLYRVTDGQFTTPKKVKKYLYNRERRLKIALLKAMYGFDHKTVLKIPMETRDTLLNYFKRLYPN